MYEQFSCYWLALATKYTVRACVLLVRSVVSESQWVLAVDSVPRARQRELTCCLTFTARFQHDQKFRQDDCPIYHLFRLFFDPEDGGDMSHGNVCWLSFDYTTLYSRRYRSWIKRLLVCRTLYDELERNGKETIVAYSRYYPDICHVKPQSRWKVPRPISEPKSSWVKASSFTVIQSRLVTWHCSQQSGGECTLGGLPRMFIGAVAFLLIISLTLPDWLGYSRLYLGLITRFFLFR
jgi:hypothetical protein